MKSFILCILLITVAYASTITEPIKVYFVISSRTGDRTIEKVYLVKENAQKYCDMYKDSHNYIIEEHKLSE